MKVKLPIATPEEFEGMTLLRIRTEGIKRIRLVDITLNDSLTLIGGENGSGKSSLLDSYAWCLGGKDAIQMDPIHHGQQEGSILCEFGDGEKVKLSVTRQILRVGEKDWTTEIQVEIPGHIAPSKIQDFLTKLAGQMSFDPMVFDALPDKEKFDTLKKFVSAFDFAGNQLARDKAFNHRTEVNRDRKREQSAADAISVADQAPCETIDEDALTAALQSAGEKNLAREQRKTKREQAVETIRILRTTSQGIPDLIINAEYTARTLRDREVSRLEEQITALRLQITSAQAEYTATVERETARLNAEAKTALTQADQLQARLNAADPLPDVIDTQGLADQIAAARASNGRYTAWKGQLDRKLAYQAEADRLGAESEELTGLIDGLDQAKTDAILAAKLPVEGLGFGDGYITLGNVPWEQASHAERIDASMAIAMKLNGKLKTILIRDGSAIGKKMRERMRQRAVEQGYRVLMEVVEEGAGSVIVIEDGMVKQKEPA